MRRPTFLHGVFAAALFALTGSITATALIPLAVTSGVYQLLVTALGLAYLLYLRPLGPPLSRRSPSYGWFDHCISTLVLCLHS